ncbi:MAG: spore cortex biosynthesis protein YabQ, partial [Bacillota bacterium]
MTPLDLQFYNVFVMVLAGVALGLCFDTYRVVRRILRPGWLATALGDLIFGLACGLLLAAALVVGNWIQMRLYVLVGLVAGAALYHELAGDVYRHALGSGLGLTQ